MNARFYRVRDLLILTFFVLAFAALHTLAHEAEGVSLPSIHNCPFPIPVF